MKDKTRRAIEKLLEEKYEAILFLPGNKVLPERMDEIAIYRNGNIEFKNVINSFFDIQYELAMSVNANDIKKDIFKAIMELDDE